MDSVGHKSVLCYEVLEYLNVQPHKIYVDVTFGVGGHTRSILESEPTCQVIAFDWDKQALEDYGEPLKEEFGDRLHLVWGNFALLYKLLKKQGFNKVDGILADFGTSQVQIAGKHGFSFFRDTPLDMRMSPAHQQITAADVVNNASEKVLQDIFFELGQEQFSRKIARAIVTERAKRKIVSTGQLVEIILAVVPPFYKGKKIHPATKVFQALRIYVNKELENIKAFLSAAVEALHPGGHLVCISFHSLEDRLVKHFFADQARMLRLKVLTPKVVMASEEELSANPSARSARLRAAEKLNV